MKPRPFPRPGIPIALLLLMLAAAGARGAAAPSGTASSGEPSTELDEVTVLGKRLWQMRQDLLEAEERFYALYNELNDDDDFDVRCVTEAPLGTRLKRRVCRAAFVDRALEDEARASLEGRYVPPADLVAVERQAEYRQKALTVISGDPRLQQLIRERIELERRYERARKERFKDRWFLFE